MLNKSPLASKQDQVDGASTVWHNSTVMQSGGRLLLFQTGAVTEAHLRMATVMASEEPAHGQITSGRSPRAWNTLRKASQEDIDPVVTRTVSQIYVQANKSILMSHDLRVWFYSMGLCRWTHMGWLRQLQSACAMSSGWCLSGLSGPAGTSACPSTSPLPLVLRRETQRQRDRLTMESPKQDLCHSAREPITDDKLWQQIAAQSDSAANRWLSRAQTKQWMNIIQRSRPPVLPRPLPPLGQYNWTRNQWVQQTITVIHPPLSITTVQLNMLTL